MSGVLCAALCCQCLDSSHLLLLPEVKLATYLQAHLQNFFIACSDQDQLSAKRRVKKSTGTQNIQVIYHVLCGRKASALDA